MTEEVKKPGFLGSLFGVDPAKQQRELAELEEKKKTIQKEGEARVAAINDMVERMRRGNQAAEETSRKTIQDIHERSRQTVTRMMNTGVIDRVVYMEEDSQGTPRMKMICQYNDGEGNIFYADKQIPSSEVPVFSQKIQQQQSSFNQLGVSERSNIRGNFKKSQDATTFSNPYRELLASQMLEKQFQARKQIKPGSK